MFLWFVRNVLKIKRNTSNIITIGECGIFPPSVHSHISCIIYLLRLKNLRSDKILISVFEENVFYDSIGFKNWYTSVSSLANSYNIDMKDMPFNDDSKKMIKTIVKNSYVENFFSA